MKSPQTPRHVQQIEINIRFMIQASSVPKRRPTARDRVRYTKHDSERKCSSEPLAASDERTEFERDRSRIIHSAAFRRLQGKTQVYLTGEGDFVRTRLTHSLEVAQIAKGVALRLRANPDLVEAVSLLHDIGHPPFGHAGETELNELMSEHGGFEANAQNLRIIGRLETINENYSGLNLTRAVIDGQLKYKVTRRENAKKFVYENDIDLVEWASNEAMAAAGVTDGEVRSFECQIMNWADDVAYAVHDLEDSIHTGFLDQSSFRQETALDENTISCLKSDYQSLGVDFDHVYDGLLSEIQHRIFGSTASRLRRVTGTQKANRKRLTSFLISRYIKGTYRTEVDERQIITRKTNRYRYQLDVPIEHQVEVAILKKIVWKHVVQSPQIRSLEEKGKYIIRSLFARFMDDDNAFSLLPTDWHPRLFSEGNKVDDPTKARVVCDYIAGMTDEYVQRTYSRFFLPNYGSIYERL